MARSGRPAKTDPDAIVTAAAAVLRERGIARLTTREVAARAGISEGSVFYHFGDRKALVKAVFERTLAPLHEFAVATPPAPESLDDVATMLMRFLGRFAEFLESGLDILLAAQADTAVRAEVAAFMVDNDYGPQRGTRVVTAYLTAAHDAGVIRPDADLPTAAYLLVSSMFLRYAQPRLVGHDVGVPDPAAVVDSVVALLTPR